MEKPKVPGHKVMSKKDLVKEHEHLVNVLKTKKKEALEKEHGKQKKELHEYKKLKDVVKQKS